MPKLNLDWSKFDWEDFAKKVTRDTLVKVPAWTDTENVRRPPEEALLLETRPFRSFDYSYTYSYTDAQKEDGFNVDQYIRGLTVQCLSKDEWEFENAEDLEYFINGRWQTFAQLMGF